MYFKELIIYQKRESIRMVHFLSNLSQNLNHSKLSTVCKKHERFSSHKNHFK